MIPKFFYLVFISFLLPQVAQTQDYKKVSDLNAFKTKYAQKSTSFSSLTSDFVQEKTITLLEDKLVSHGNFKYKKPDKLRMEYFKPYSYVFIMVGDKVITKNNQKETSVSTKSNKLYKTISQLTIDCINGNILNSKEFTSSVFENNSTYLLKLIPKNADLKAFLDEIDITISKSDYTADKIEMKEASGDNTLMVFSNKQINAAISDEVFVR